MDTDGERPDSPGGDEPEEQGWYFDLPSGAWERQEAKSRELREKIRRNSSDAGSAPSPRRESRFGRSEGGEPDPRRGSLPGGWKPLRRADWPADDRALDEALLSLPDAGRFEPPPPAPEPEAPATNVTAFEPWRHSDEGRRQEDASAAPGTDVDESIERWLERVRSRSAEESPKVAGPAEASFSPDPEPAEPPAWVPDVPRRAPIESIDPRASELRITSISDYREEEAWPPEDEAPRARTRWEEMLDGPPDIPIIEGMRRWAKGGDPEDPSEDESPRMPAQGRMAQIHSFEDARGRPRQPEPFAASQPEPQAELATGSEDATGGGFFRKLFHRSKGSESTSPPVEAEDMPARGRASRGFEPPSDPRGQDLDWLRGIPSRVHTDNDDAADVPPATRPDGLGRRSAPGDEPPWDAPDGLAGRAWNSAPEGPGSGDWDAPEEEWRPDPIGGREVVDFQARRGFGRDDSTSGAYEAPPERSDPEEPRFSREHELPPEPRPGELRGAAPDPGPADSDSSPWGDLFGAVEREQGEPPPPLFPGGRNTWLRSTQEPLETDAPHWPGPEEAPAPIPMRDPNTRRVDWSRHISDVRSGRPHEDDAAEPPPPEAPPGWRSPEPGPGWRRGGFDDLLGAGADELVDEADSQTLNAGAVRRHSTWDASRPTARAAADENFGDEPFFREPAPAPAPWQGYDDPAIGDVDAGFLSDESSGGEVKSHHRRSIARELIETGLLALLVFLAVRASFQNFKVDGSSMYPTLQDGQFLIVNKLIYSEVDVGKISSFVPFIDAADNSTRNVFHGPERGDIIVLKDPRDPKTDLIKRVIGLPGESIEIVEGKVYVNDMLLIEPYIKTAWHDTRPKVTIPAGEYFVMGDNRDNSLDSRSPNVGLVPRELVIGKAMLSYWPLDQFGLAPNEAGDVSQKDGRPKLTTMRPGE